MSPPALRPEASGSDDRGTTQNGAAPRPAPRSPRCASALSRPAPSEHRRGEPLARADTWVRGPPPLLAPVPLEWTTGRGEPLGARTPQVQTPGGKDTPTRAYRHLGARTPGRQTRGLQDPWVRPRAGGVRRHWAPSSQTLSNCPGSRQPRWGLCQQTALAAPRPARRRRTLGSRGPQPGVRRRGRGPRVRGSAGGRARSGREQAAGGNEWPKHSQAT